MGGIKNRDEKRKAAKVFSSGGGGGTKGPAVVDKRNQELPCPHCERTFKQPGRLQDHIRKQHAQEDAEGGGSDPAPAVSSAALPAAAGIAAGPAAAASTNGAAQRMILHSLGAAPQPAGQPRGAAGDGGRAGPSGPAGGGAAAGSRAPTPAPSSAGAPAGSTAGAAGGMMDVGSRGGFYSSKSPKLLLHEMCLKEKVKPRYKATQAADGLWKCKVVIPHPKNSDKDVVVFLDDSHAAPSQEEAAQRAAVAALNRVAGDRALERVLPREFVPLWNQLGMERKEREERRAKQAARQASQAARQKAAASRRQTPATVIMTEEKRRLVEGLISGLSLAEAPGQAVAAPGSYAVGGSASSLTGGETLASSEEGVGGGFSSGWDDYESDSEALSEALPETRLGGGEGATGSLGSGQGDALPAAAQALLDELLLLGFSEGHARRALAACYGTGGGGGSSGSSGQGLSLPAALDWLSLNVAEEELPAHFAPGAAGKPVSVLRREGASSASLATSASAGALADADGAVGADDVDLSDPAVAELRQFGYPPAKCAAALREGAGDVPAALGLLFRQLAGEPAQPGDSPPDLQEWQEERTALEAIYDSDVTFHSPSWTTLRLAVPCDGTAASADGTAADGTAVLHLECWAPASGAYPQQLPTLAVRCADVPPEALLSLTHQLALRAVELRGHPMLFELASAVTELLPLCIADPPLLPPGFLAGAAVDGSSIGGTAPVPATGDGAWDAGSASSLGSSQRGSMCDLAAAEHAQQAQQARQGGGADFGREPQRLYQPLPAGAAGTTGRPAKPPRSSRTGAASSRQRPQPGPGWEAAECQRLQEHQAQLGRAPAHAAMRAVRSRLPAAAQRGEVVGLLASRQVLVISGATGCGKSTQVPQFVLEEAIAGGQGARCNIVCTQPRRISAVGLAGRVAAERGERVGEVVGYAVRLDSKQSQRTRLLFCTTGILLRRLLADPTLTGTTHVVLDEVHERSIESDLLLLLLRNLLVTGANPGLRVILMSATADAELFASYFQQRLGQPCGMVSIPGFTHPVTDYCLEDALEATGFEVGKNSKWAKKQGGKEKDAAGAGKKGGGGGAASGSLEGYSDQTRTSLQNLEEAQVNYDLVEALVRHVVEARQAQHAQQGAAAAILIFAPGAEEINRVCRALQGSPRLWVLPLHGGLPPAQQARVFDRPPRGTVKVVVATNVAETSITIDDVTCVIDCGRVKEMRFDPERGIARLQETWVSQASAQQRRGRAGRVQPGVCYRLLSRATWGRLQKDTPPEVLRAPLQGLVLDVKGILGAEADVGSVLAQMITPPAAATLQQALGSLQQIGALGALPALPLTPLGCHLTRMPCDPRIAKMLVFGALLRCLDPVLTIAAAQGYGRPVFFSPPDRRAEADAAKRSLVAHIAGSKSDHLAVVAAYNGWAAAVERGGRGAGQDFCSKHFVADQAMEGIDAGRRQYAEILADLGFVPAGYAALAGRAGAAARSAQQGGAEVDQYSGNARVVKAALCAGFYPQLLRVDHPAAKFAKVLGGAVETAADPAKLKFFDRYKGRVFLHPSSLNFTCGKFESGWTVYSEVVQTSKVFVRESSMVPIYAILLFGGEISVSHEAGLVQVDGWATFKAPARIAVLVRELRSQCAALLAQKIADPGLDVSGSRVVEAMHHLLATDGF